MLVNKYILYFNQRHFTRLKQLSSRARLFHTYASGLMYTNHTHLSVAEYWRWWVVHLWVEGFFEVFATVAIAYLCSELGFLKRSSALRATYLTKILYLGSGVIGTLHHLYFAGTPVFVTAMGSVASALEVVPLTLIGFEVVKSLKLSQEAQGFYRMPLKFFMATCFWNLVGAGVFGFLINPPIFLYYSQGLNTTPIHAHSALYGVYGSLAIALMLFALREITPDSAWDENSNNFHPIITSILVNISNLLKPKQVGALIHKLLLLGGKQSAIHGHNVDADYSLTRLEAPS